MKATKAQVRRRVDELVQFRLDGAQFWHICEYVRAKEQEEGSAWYRGDGKKPFSDATLWRYIGKVDDQIAAEFHSSRKKLVRQHVARRRNIFAKAMAKGDLRTAIAASDSEAKLLNLFPASGVEVTGKGGNALIPSFDAMVAAIIKLRQAGGTGNAANDNREGDESDESPPGGN